ncbi:hypothetical protein [Burkholderia glumae]|uniref:hypothetical protein n=1 Tax=Burkholderia glumae TaxID=337 RepID=UPI0012D2B33D|nr:hypothetical protein [Burkholderia glumae]
MSAYSRDFVAASVQRRQTAKSVDLTNQPRPICRCKVAPSACNWQLFARADSKTNRTLIFLSLNNPQDSREMKKYVLWGLSQLVLGPAWSDAHHSDIGSIDGGARHDYVVGDTFDTVSELHNLYVVPFTGLLQIVAKGGVRLQHYMKFRHLVFAPGLVRCVTTARKSRVLHIFRICGANKIRLAGKDRK